MMPTRTGTSFSFQNDPAFIVGLSLAIVLGMLALLVPFYVSLFLLALLLYSVSLVEKPATVLYSLAFIAPQINIMVTGGHSIGKTFVYDHHNFLLVDFLSLAIVIVIAIGRVTGKVGPIRRRSFDLPLLFLAGYAAASLLWVKDLSSGLVIFLELCSCIVIFYSPILLMKEKRTAEIFLWIWLIIAIYSAILSISTLYVHYGHGILYRATQYFDDSQYMLRFVVIVFAKIKKRVGGFADPNRVAHYLNTALLAGLVLYLHAKKRFAKICIGLVMFLLLYTIVHTLSKAGIGSLMAIVFFYVLLHKRFSGKAIRTLLIFFIALVTCIVLMSVIDLSGGLGRFGESPAETSGNMSLALRLKWWQASLTLLFASGGLGAGVGGIAGHDWSYAQSVYFSLLADLGLIGFLLAAYFLFTYAVELYTLMKKIYDDNFYYSLALMAAGCVGLFFIHALVDFGYNLRLPWLMAGLALAAAEMGNNALAPQEKEG